MITVVICLLTAMVHLIPSRSTFTAKQVAELMFEEIYKHYGLPRSIVNDRDSLFTSLFWEHLHKLVGTQLQMSSAYHPKTDGSTECANRTVTQMLRQCINKKQTDWVARLPAVEFAINSARSESTGYVPFFLNTGWMPRPMIWDLAPVTEYPSVRNFALQKKLAIMAAHDSVIAVRVKQTRNTNRKRQSSPFKPGSLVYVLTKNIMIPKGLARKLVPKFIGPYKILRDFGNFSYRIDLPHDLKQQGVHDTFHASYLRMHQANDDRLFPGRLHSQVRLSDEAEGEWSIDKIVSHIGKGELANFEVKWCTGDVIWVPYETIAALPAMTNYLDLQGASGIADLSAGKEMIPQKDPQMLLGEVSLEIFVRGTRNLHKHPENSPPAPQQ